MGVLYLIYHPQSGCHKIGISENWEQRRRALKVGSYTQLVTTVTCDQPRKWERILHKMFDENRAPGSEYFKIDRDEAIRKFNWVESKISGTRMIIGNWKTNANGDLYRRRKSKNGHWYTQHAGNTHVMVDNAIREAERTINMNDSSYEQVVHPERWTTKTVYSEGRYIWLGISAVLLFSQSPLVIAGFFGLLWTMSHWSKTEAVRIGA